MYMIISKLSHPFVYRKTVVVEEIPPGSPTGKPQFNVITKKVPFLVLQGSVNVSVETPSGSVEKIEERQTMISEETYEWLKEEKRFKDHMRNGFVRCVKCVNAEQASEKEASKISADLEKMDGSAQPTPSTMDDPLFHVSSESSQEEDPRYSNINTNNKNLKKSNSFKIGEAGAHVVGTSLGL